MLFGSLDSLEVSTVLTMVAGAKLSGRLDIDRTDQRGAFSFVDGVVVAASVEGMPTDERDDVIDAAMTLLEGLGGEFAFSETPVEGVVKLNVAEVVSSASKRRARWHAIEAELGDVEEPFSLSAHRSPKSGQVTLTPHQWNVISSVDGKRGVTGIARAAGISRFNAASTLVELVAIGLVARTQRDEQAEPPASQTVSPVERVAPHRTARMGVIRRKHAQPHIADVVDEISDAPRRVANAPAVWVKDPETNIAYPSGSKK